MTGSIWNKIQLHFTRAYVVQLLSRSYSECAVEITSRKAMALPEQYTSPNLTTPSTSRRVCFKFVFYLYPNFLLIFTINNCKYLILNAVHFKVEAYCNPCVKGPRFGQKKLKWVKSLFNPRISHAMVTHFLPYLFRTHYLSNRLFSKSADVAHGNPTFLQKDSVPQKTNFLLSEYRGIK